MTPQNITHIQKIISQFTEVNRPIWVGILSCWIANCDLFLAQLELSDSSDADFLIKKIEKSLAKLRSDSSDADLIDVLSYEFEGNYFHAQFPHRPRWDFRIESFQTFCWRHRGKDTQLTHYPNLLLVEQSVISPSDIKVWLLTFFPKVDK